MFYESQVFKPRQAATVLEAAEMVKSGTAKNWEAVNFLVADQSGKAIPVYLVNDMDIHSSPFFETAVIIEENGKFFQVESLTVGWMKSAEELAEYIQKAVDSPFMKSKADLNIGQPDAHKTANFTCGCCGSGFRGDVKKQLQFDQDTGYGICPKCETFYS